VPEASTTHGQPPEPTANAFASAAGLLPPGLRLAVALQQCEQSQYVADGAVFVGVVIDGEITRGGHRGCRQLQPMDSGITAGSAWTWRIKCSPAKVAGPGRAFRVVPLMDSTSPPHWSTRRRMASCVFSLASRISAVSTPE
jgi:hypothetical protein